MILYNIGDSTRLAVAGVTVVIIVFNWVFTEYLDLQILRHFQTSQEKVFSKNFGTHEREQGHIEVCIWESSAHRSGRGLGNERRLGYATVGTITAVCQTLVCIHKNHKNYPRYFSFFLTALLRYVSHTIKFTHLKYTI